MELFLSSAFAWQFHGQNVYAYLLKRKNEWTLRKVNLSNHTPKS